MKKIIITAALILLCASLMSCDMINRFFRDDIKLGDKSDGAKTEEQGALITLVSSNSSSLTVRIENSTDSTWQSGNMRDYSLEAEKNGEWYTVNQVGELANTMELMIFAPGETLTHTFEFKERYGNLPSGKYRVVKSFWANKTETADAHEFHLVCEFTVE